MRGPLPVMQDKPAAECSTEKAERKAQEVKRCFPIARETP
jgi:hypothetical protein